MPGVSARAPDPSTRWSTGTGIEFGEAKLEWREGDFRPPHFEWQGPGQIPGKGIQQVCPTRHVFVDLDHKLAVNFKCQPHVVNGETISLEGHDLRYVAPVERKSSIRELPAKTAPFARKDDFYTVRKEMNGSESLWLHLRDS
jgi:hypothetical protein